MNLRLVYILLLALFVGGGYRQTVSAQCTSCQSDEALEDAGTLCTESGFEALADLQAQLLLSCPLSLFPLGMDGCCGSLLQYDWWFVQSCLCSGKTGLAGLIVSPKNIIESCGCVAIDRSTSRPPSDSATPAATTTTGIVATSNGSDAGTALAGAAFKPQSTD